MALARCEFDAPPYTAEEHKAYLAAVAQAQVRAAHSYFHQHIIREEDGSYWVADEGSHEPLIDWLSERIVCTIDAGLIDEV